MLIFSAARGAGLGLGYAPLRAAGGPAGVWIAVVIGIFVGLLGAPAEHWGDPIGDIARASDRPSLDRLVVALALEVVIGVLAGSFAGLVGQAVTGGVALGANASGAGAEAARLLSAIALCLSLAVALELGVLPWAGQALARLRATVALELGVVDARSALHDVDLLGRATVAATSLTLVAFTLATPMLAMAAVVDLGRVIIDRVGTPMTPLWALLRLSVGILALTASWRIHEEAWANAVMGTWGGEAAGVQAPGPR